MLFLVTVALGAPLIPDQGPTDPSTTKDPDSMCGKGAPGKQQQAQAAQQGMTKDWASGAVLPKAAEAPALVAPSAVAVAPSAVAVAPVAVAPAAVAPAAVAEDGTPLPSLAAPTDPSCISLKTGTPDFWCPTRAAHRPTTAQR